MQCFYRVRRFAFFRPAFVASLSLDLFFSLHFLLICFCRFTGCCLCSPFGLIHCGLFKPTKPDSSLLWRVEPSREKQTKFWFTPGSGIVAREMGIWIVFEARLDPFRPNNDASGTAPPSTINTHLVLIFVILCVLRYFLSLTLFRFWISL